MMIIMFAIEDKMSANLLESLWRISSVTTILENLKMLHSPSNGILHLRLYISRPRDCARCNAPYLDFFRRSNASCVGCRTDVMEMGVMTPNQVPVQSLQAREVGCLCRNINDVLDACVEDTIHFSKKYKATVQEGKMIEPRPGYADSVPIVCYMVDCRLLPLDADGYANL
jgi:hypothetical protein